MSAVKRCNTCRQELPLERFSHRSDTRDGLQFSCKPCLSKATVAARVEARREALISNAVPRNERINRSKEDADRYREMARARTDKELDALERHRTKT